MESAASRRPKVNGKDDPPWREALDYVVECGLTVVKLTQSDVQKDGGGGGGDDPSAEDNGAKGGFVALTAGTQREDELDLRLERISMSYKVVRSPIVFVRAAPKIDAEILTMMPAGMSFTVDARRGGSGADGTVNQSDRWRQAAQDGRRGWEQRWIGRAAGGGGGIVIFLVTHRIVKRTLISTYTQPMPTLHHLCRLHQPTRGLDHPRQHVANIWQRPLAHKHTVLRAAA